MRESDKRQPSALFVCAVAARNTGNDQSINQSTPAHTEKVGRVQACGREEEGRAIGLNEGTKESAIAAGADLDKPPTDTDSMHA